MRILSQMPLEIVESFSMQELDVEKIKDLRETADLTQVQAAAKAGMSVSRWNDIECGGRKNLTLETLSVIADALGCDARDLIRPRAVKKNRKQ